MRMLTSSSLALTATASVLILASTTAAVAVPSARGVSGRATDRTLVRGVQAPFQIALRHGTVYFADGGAGTVNKLTRRGPEVVRKVPEVAGVEFSRDGRTMAIASGSPMGTARQRVTFVRGGRVRVVADILAYERRVNPDRNVTYGVIAGGNPTCNAALSKMTGSPATYKGIVDSHPYQLAPLRGGAFALADAGINAILRIGPRGGISTIALLPRQLITLTGAQAGALGVPSCAGVTYAFEPVPTDVERGPRGSLLVSTLPGGPESPALGARGSVYRIKHGVVRKVAGGFLGATNLAVTRRRVYVTEFFAGKITKIGAGGRITKYRIPGAVSIEATRRHLYVGALGMGPSAPGKIIRLPR